MSDEAHDHAGDRIRALEAHVAALRATCAWCARAMRLLAEDAGRLREPNLLALVRQIAEAWDPAGNPRLAALHEAQRALEEALPELALQAAARICDRCRGPLDERPWAGIQPPAASAWDWDGVRDG